MQVSSSTRTVNEIRYTSENSRMSVEDFMAASKDMKSRGVPKDAHIVLGTAKSFTVRY